MVAAAEKWIGTPYSWGGGDSSGPTYGIGEGAGTKGFDCSGLVRYAVYQASAGKIYLDHSSEDQMTMGTLISSPSAPHPDAMQPGDIIGFQMKSNGDYDHVGIYIGNNQMVVAPETGQNVQIQSLNTSFWEAIPQMVRRFG